MIARPKTFKFNYFFQMTPPTIIKLILLALLALYAFRGFSLKNELPPLPANGDTLTLRIEEEKVALGGEVRIKYNHYGHENSSSAPGEPFSATVGVYSFEVAANGNVDTITIYKGVDEPSSNIDWKHYKIALFYVSEGQDEVGVAVVDTTR